MLNTDNKSIQLKKLHDHRSKNTKFTFLQIKKTHNYIPHSKPLRIRNFFSFGNTTKTLVQSHPVLLVP